MVTASLKEEKWKYLLVNIEPAFSPRYTPLVQNWSNLELAFNLSGTVGKAILGQFLPLKELESDSALPRNENRKKKILKKTSTIIS